MQPSPKRIDVPAPSYGDNSFRPSGWDLHGNFAIVAADTLAGIVAEYQDECARSRTVVAEASLEDPAQGPEMAFTLRYALAHMVEETARHCGHLDLLREVIDGQVGM